MDTPGLVYQVTTLPLGEYEIKYIYPQQRRAKRHCKTCCITRLIRTYLAWMYNCIKPSCGVKREWLYANVQAIHP
jgi:hypothetical protein